VLRVHPSGPHVPGPGPQHPIPDHRAQLHQAHLEQQKCQVSTGRALQALSLSSMTSARSQPAPALSQPASPSAASPSSPPAPPLYSGRFSPHLYAVNTCPRHNLPHASSSSAVLTLPTLTYACSSALRGGWSADTHRDASTHGDGGGGGGWGLGWWERRRGWGGSWGGKALSGLGLLFRPHFRRRW